MDVQKKSVSFTNVPKNVTEKQLHDLFGRLGQVIGLRLKQGFKGGAAATNYGEVDYLDVPTAENAAKQLNGHVFGNVQMRVAHGVKTRKRRMGGRSGDDPDAFTLEFSRFQRIDDVKHGLRGLPVDLAYEAVEQLRILCLERPEQAEELLKANPQLTAAAVLILQHAGRLPLHLPAEAFSLNIDLNTASGADAVEGAPAASANDEAVMKLVEELDDEALEQILELTDAELAAMDAAERAQLVLVRTYLQRAAASAS